MTSVIPLRSICLLMLAVLITSLAIPARAQGSPTITDDIADRAGAAAWWGDYAELRRIYSSAKASRDPTPDGESQLDAFATGFARIFNGSLNDAYHGQVVAMTRQWVAEHPHDSLAHNAHARALLAYAWSARGSGFASSVLPQAWAEFSKRVSAAEEHLLKRPTLLDETSVIYLLMIERAAGRDFDTQWRLAQDALGKPGAGTGIHGELVASALPKWGGDARQMDRVAQDALKRNAEGRGLEMYARVYTYVAKDLLAGLFKHTRADWPKMKQGFQEMVTRFPTNGNLNRFAFVACLAGDKETTVELLDRIGGKPSQQFWGGGTQMMEGCLRWARTS